MKIGSREATDWINYQGRALLCTWAARRAEQGLAWPGASTELLFLGASLSGELTELREALTRLPIDAGSIADETADVLIYLAMFTYSIGPPYSERVFITDLPHALSMSAAYKACGFILNQAKKCFRDGTPIDVSMGNLFVIQLRIILGCVLDICHNFLTQPLDVVIARKEQELRKRAHFTARYMLLDDEVNWPIAQLLAMRNAAGY